MSLCATTDEIMKRLLVVDDHPMIRLGIETILRPRPEWEVCGTAGSGAEAIQKASELHPEIIIMDISMPGMSGLEATRVIHSKWPEVKILLLTLYDSVEWVETAFRAGARGYLLKSETEGELLRALEVVSSDALYASPGLDANRIQRLMMALGQGPRSTPQA